MYSKKKIFLFSLISITGWLFASFIMHTEIKTDHEYIKVKISENAFNIVSQALQDQKTDKEIIQQMEIWFDKGWTAQTGSVTTICNNNRAAFKQIMSDNTITTICRLRI
ncbi:hypothetical protein [Photobacterium carnosum]|jgi:hypothetical protein|uniref:Uncharacterized protein n=1 Tax=Photobacterium carnosum TaxID=2023717 RepID=A0A2N4UVL8_9GAMM|nr:hypothetical protein [Photobacterium carnosum]KAE8177309.1 hypothetical protein CIT27_08390 [Photobacterium carnosum]MBY3787846.1 hypothetical protein [Photobacterium carnosum]MCD9498917.1 hypothetical protein [Photobacterium carnosum]MCD9514285.1 hypothetical protein [Photobacterium carnosum]MCD9521541.1 hypothetical protein [Photobacterium carnosum]